MADQEANGTGPAEGQAPANQGGAETEIIEVPKKNQTPAEPPVTFREFNVRWQKNFNAKLLLSSYNDTKIVDNLIKLDN